MTTYAYTITLNDTESIMLHAALELMIEHCEQKLENGPLAPYVSRKKCAQEVLARLYDNTMQTSGSSF